MLSRFKAFFSSQALNISIFPYFAFSRISGRRSFNDCWLERQKHYSKKNGKKLKKRKIEKEEVANY